MASKTKNETNTQVPVFIERIITNCSKTPYLVYKVNPEHTNDKKEHWIVLSLYLNYIFVSDCVKTSDGAYLISKDNSYISDYITSIARAWNLYMDKYNPNENKTKDENTTQYGFDYDKCDDSNTDDIINNHVLRQVKDIIKFEVSSALIKILVQKFLFPDKLIGFKLGLELKELEAEGFIDAIVGYINRFKVNTPLVIDKIDKEIISFDKLSELFRKKHKKMYQWLADTSKKYNCVMPEYFYFMFNEEYIYPKSNCYACGYAKFFDKKDKHYDSKITDNTCKNCPLEDWICCCEKNKPKVKPARYRLRISELPEMYSMTAEIIATAKWKNQYDNAIIRFFRHLSNKLTKKRNDINDGYDFEL